MSKFKVGDILECINDDCKKKAITEGNSYTVIRVADREGVDVVNDSNSESYYYDFRFKLKENNIMKGLQSYIEKNQDTIYTLLLVVLIDHFFLGGSLRSKIESTVNGILNKQLDKSNES